MDFELSNCVAMGVRDAEEAAAHYERVLGWRRGESRGPWIEMTSGPFRLYLVSDDVTQPTFEMLVSDPVPAMGRLLSEGWVRTDLGMARISSFEIPMVISTAFQRGRDLETRVGVRELC